MAEPRIPTERIDEASAPLEDRDHRRLSRVDRSLARGLTLLEWWQQKNQPWAHEPDSARFYEHARDAYPESFPLLRPLPRWGDHEINFGYFDEAPIHGPGDLKPVMGLFHQRVFDDPKTVAEDYENPYSEAVLERWRQGFQIFVNRHLLRPSSLERVAVHVDEDRRSIANWLRPLSWWPQVTQDQDRGGFGFSQIYYKRQDNGRVGKFPEVDRDAVDVHRVTDKYDWIVVKIHIYDVFLGAALESLNVNLDDEVLAIVSREILLEDHEGDDHVRSRHGFGYIFLQDTREAGDQRPWRRPQYGIQLIQFLVLRNGRILSRVAMVSEKLPQLLELGVDVWTLEIADRLSLGFFKPFLRAGVGFVDQVTPGFADPFLQPAKQLAQGIPVVPTFDPVSTFANVANFVSGGAAARNLGISVDVLLRTLLANFARSAAYTTADLRSVWRAVPDWTVPNDELPEWARL